MKRQPPNRNPQHTSVGPAPGDKGRAMAEVRQHKGYLEARQDGWGDIVSGARTMRDPRSRNYFQRSREIPYQEAERMYENDGLVRRVIDTIPDLITRDPWTVQGDTSNDIWQYLEKRMFMQRLRRALKWGKLYGGGILVIGADDGQDWAEPLNIERVRTIEFFRVYDRYSVTGTLEDWQHDPMNKRFGEREWYTIYPRGVIVPTGSFRVHWTRVIQCDGVTTTDVRRAQNYGWDDSLLKIVTEDIRRYVTGLDDSSTIIRDFMQAVLNVDNLDKLLLNKDNNSQWKNRVEMMDLTRHTLNMMVLGKEEVYTKSASSVAGLPDLLDRLMMQVCATTGYPMSVLFGRSAGGLNASSEPEIRAFYDECGAEQRETIAPAVQLVASIVLHCDDYDGEQPEEGDIHVMFPTIWKMTAGEEAKLRWDVAQADAIYITNQVVSPDEVAVSRFGGDSYSTETTLGYDRDPEHAPEPPTPEPTAPTGTSPSAKGGTGAPGTES